MEVVPQYALPAALATVGAMYLDAKHHIAKDLTTWYGRRQFAGIVKEGQELMGDYWTLYHALELNDPKADAFWFEGRSWTFEGVRREADKLAQWLIDQGVKTAGIELFEKKLI